jgi:hypothetical protein
MIVSFGANPLVSITFFTAPAAGGPLGTAITFSLTVTIPQCQTRDQELAYAEYACLACARQARAAGGQVTSGVIQAQPNMLPGPQIALATYTYTPQAPR